MTKTLSVELSDAVLEAAAKKTADSNTDLSSYVEALLARELEASAYLCTPVAVVVQQPDPDAERKLLRMPYESDEQFARRLRVFQKSLAKM